MLDRALSQLFEYAIDSLPAIRTWMASVVDFVHSRFDRKLYDSGVHRQHWSFGSVDTCFNGCCILGWHWSLIQVTPASMEIFWHFNSGALGQLTLYDCRALGQHWSLTQLTPVSMDVTYLDCIGR